MFRNFTIIAIVAWWSVSTVLADTWKSPDGFLEITQPDTAKYPSVKPHSPPELSRWQATDGSMTFGVDLVPHLAGFKPSEENMELAYGGKHSEVKRLPKREIAGHEVWSIRVTGGKVTQTIAVIHHDGWFHRVKASGLTEEFDSKAANRFLKSIKIRDGDWTPPNRALGPDLTTRP